jgi:outer membrane protein TolC
MKKKKELKIMQIATYNKIILMAIIAFIIQVSQISLANTEIQDTEIIDNDEVTEEIPVIYPAVIDSSKSLRKSFQSKLNSLKSKDKNKTIVKSEDLEYDEFDDENIVEKKNFWKKFTKTNDNQQKDGLDSQAQEKRLTKIQNIIENEKYLNHDVNNDIYLDKYKRKELSTLEDFYRNKDIVESDDGTLMFSVKENERLIDKLIDEIENADPNDETLQPLRLTLKECIGIALAKHPDILSARLSTDVYKDRIIQAWSAYFPNFSAGIDYSKYNSKMGGYKSDYASHYVPNLSAGLMLFDFGKTKTVVDIAKTDYEASTFNLESSINEIIYAVKSSYYNLLFAQKQIEVYKNTIDSFELQLKVAKKYFEIGKKPQIDVMIAEYNAGNAKLNLVKAINTLEVARVNLANTLGLPGLSKFELADDLSKLEYDVDLDVLLNDAFTIRPDLLSQAKSVEAAYLTIRSAKRGYLPDLMANGSYYKGETDSVSQSNFQLGVNLTYSGNLMQTKKEVDIALKSYEKALADYESSKQRVYLDVKQSYINLDSTKKSVKQAEINVEQAKAQSYHATGRYNAGYGDAIELKDSENTYLNAQLEYFQALLDYNSEAANIERLVGRPLIHSENSL